MRGFGTGRALGLAVGIPLFGFLVLPLLMVFPMAFNESRYMQFPPQGLSTEWFESVLSSSSWRSAAVTSLQVGIVSALLAVTLGTIASFGLVRARMRGKTLVFAFLLSPMIVPEIIIAISMYFIATDLDLIGNRLVLAVGQASLAIPAVVVVVSSSLQGISRNLEVASTSLGASRWRTFWSVIFPLIRPGIGTAALFAFLVSFDDLILALYLGGPSTTTVPMQIWSGIRFDTSPAIAVVSTMLVTLAFLFLGLTEIMHRRAARRRAAATAGIVS